MSNYHVRPPSRDQRDTQTGNLRSRSTSRDMGWRKPVPKFIPSPPMSPNQSQYPQHTGSPTATTFDYLDRTNPFSMSLASLKNDLPPLPDDWRENIDRVTKNESSTNLRSLRTPQISPVITSPAHGFAHGYRHGSESSHIPDSNGDQFQEVDLGERKSRSHRHFADKENIPPPVTNHGLKRLVMSPGANASTVSVARTPKTYRPPTPPLPSRKKTSAPPTPITTTAGKPMHIVYPDLTGLGADTHTERARSPESDNTTDAHTLQTARSSLTGWTGAAGASTDASTLNDDDDQTLPVYQPHSMRKSTVGSKSMLVVEPHNQEPGFWKAFGLWFDSLSSPFKSCLTAN